MSEGLQSSIDPSADGDLDVFLAYSRGDIAEVRAYRSALETLGCNVWYDNAIDPGPSWNNQTHERLIGSRTVIVLWSMASKYSPSVHDEADLAIELRKFIGIVVNSDDGYPTTALNVRFRSSTFIDCQNWGQSFQSKGFGNLVSALIQSWVRKSKFDVALERKKALFLKEKDQAKKDTIFEEVKALEEAAILDRSKAFDRAKSLYAKAREIGVDLTALDAGDKDIKRLFAAVGAVSTLVAALTPQLHDRGYPAQTNNAPQTHRVAVVPTVVIEPPRDVPPKPVDPTIAYAASTDARTGAGSSGKPKSWLRLGVGSVISAASVAALLYVNADAPPPTPQATPVQETQPRPWSDPVISVQNQATPPPSRIVGVSPSSSVPDARHVSGAGTALGSEVRRPEVPASGSEPNQNYAVAEAPRPPVPATPPPAAVAQRTTPTPANPPAIAALPTPTFVPTSPQVGPSSLERFLRRSLPINAAVTLDPEGDSLAILEARNLEGLRIEFTQSTMTFDAIDCAIASARGRSRCTWSVLGDGGRLRVVGPAPGTPHSIAIELRGETAPYVADVVFGALRMSATMTIR